MKLQIKKCYIKDGKCDEIIKAFHLPEELTSVLSDHYSKEPKPKTIKTFLDEYCKGINHAVIKETAFSDTYKNDHVELYSIISGAFETEEESLVYQELFAFWNYDTVPYLLGAEITAWHENGTISAKGYEGMRFRPRVIVPLLQGIKIKETLKKIESEYQNEQEKLKEKYKNNINLTFSEVVTFPKL